MTYDLIIRNGTIVDGLGGEPYVGDVAVRDSVIAAVGTVNGSSAKRGIDAPGRLITRALSISTPPTTARPSGRSALPRPQRTGSPRWWWATAASASRRAARKTTNCSSTWRRAATILPVS